MKRSAVVLLAEGFEMLEAVAPVDVLRRADMAVTLASVGPERTVASSGGLVIVADRLLADVDFTPDLVVLPGGMPGAANIAASAEARALAERVRAADGWVAALCASPAVALGPWGFLAGKRATVYPAFVSELPPGATAVDAAVVRDGRLITGRGPGAALPFSLELVSALAGDDLAERLREGMCVA